MFKRTISLMLSLALFLAIGCPVFAVENDLCYTQKVAAYISDLDSHTSSEIESKALFLQNIGIIGKEKGIVCGIELNGNDAKNDVFRQDSITYFIDYGEFVEKITFTSFSDTEITFVVESGDIFNTITVKKDGTLLIDDANVADVSRNLFNCKSDVATRASSRWCQTSCPYGTPTDYTKSAGSFNNSNVALTDFLKNLSFSAVLALFGAINLPAGVVFGFSSIVYSGLQEASPNSKGLSYKDTKTWHKSCGSASGGYISAFGAYVTKHSTKWYAEKNYNKYKYTVVDYEIHEIY